MRDSRRQRAFVPKTTDFGIGLCFNIAAASEALRSHAKPAPPHSQTKDRCSKCRASRPKNIFDLVHASHGFSSIPIMAYACG
mmetsp:Transcript_8880/g.31515  ORF Transcript_8880/g.31515 Transcript_8880/m.31515 type:complete len:82 (-) Transcript_8880:469-714(-)